MKALRILPILLLAMTFVNTSCKKSVVEVNTDYVGYWEGDDDNAMYTIYIDEYGNGEYDKYGSGHTYSYGKVKVNSRESKLKVGLLGFKIEQAPTQVTIDGVTYWEMILDGVTYYRL